MSGSLIILFLGMLNVEGRILKCDSVLWEFSLQIEFTKRNVDRGEDIKYEGDCSTQDISIEPNVGNKWLKSWNCENKCLAR